MKNVIKSAFIPSAKIIAHLLDDNTIVIPVFAPANMPAMNLTRDEYLDILEKTKQSEITEDQLKYVNDIFDEAEKFLTN